MLPSQKFKLERGLVFKRYFLLIGAVCCFFSIRLRAEQKPILDYLQGSQFIEMGGRNLTVGEELSAGDRIRTDASTVARVLYPDHTLVIVGNSSEYEIQAQDSSQVQWS